MRSARCIDLDAPAGTNLSRMRLHVDAAAHTLMVTSRRRPLIVIDTRERLQYEEAIATVSGPQFDRSRGRSGLVTVSWCGSSRSAPRSTARWSKRHQRCVYRRVALGLTRQLEDVFRYLLMLRDDEPHDPAVFVTGVPNWSVSETIMLGDGQRLRILSIETEIAERLIEEGIVGVFTVELA